MNRDVMMERLRDRYAPVRPIDVQYLLRDGLAVHEILHAAKEVGTDLIVMGTQGRTGLLRILAGSVAEAVLRQAPCPVLALHAPEDLPSESGPIDVILHPTDFSRSSAGALQVARALARDQGARLLLLHVAPAEVVESVALAAPLDPRSVAEPLDALRASIEGKDLKYPVEVRSARGDSATEILREAREIDCDLIVLGSHGRSALSRMLMGSVAESVLRRATCPTLIVTTPRQDPADVAAEPVHKSVVVL